VQKFFRILESLGLKKIRETVPLKDESMVWSLKKQ